MPPQPALIIVEPSPPDSPSSSPPASPAHIKVRLATDDTLTPLLNSCNSLIRTLQVKQLDGGPVSGPVGGPVGGFMSDELCRSCKAFKVVLPLPREFIFYYYWDFFRKCARTPRFIGSNKPDLLASNENCTLSTVTSLEHDVKGNPGHTALENENGMTSCEKAVTSYEVAATICTQKVEAIVRECKRLNQKYYDRVFDLPSRDSLRSLGAKKDPDSLLKVGGVGAVKRIEEIFDQPKFFNIEESANPAIDMRQGNLGDCWFLAALAALSGKRELLNRLCVARDEKVGVYGFVFFRDGEWISEVVDDRLCTKYSNEEQKHPTDFMVFTDGSENYRDTPLAEIRYSIDRLPKEFREKLRKGCASLYFGSCRESSETWLPLIEKAYAKVHGDYQTLHGGYTGEGIEDLTGGIACCFRSSDVLDKDQLWEELKQVNDKFLFGCGTRRGRDDENTDDEGFVREHAYTILEAREIEIPLQKTSGSANEKHNERDNIDMGPDGKVRLLKLHNPWGKQKFNGRWSNGSKEWTADIMKELNHTFGDNGVFYISYLDFLKFFPMIDRIRLIGPEWIVTQQWTSVNVPRTSIYMDTSFKITVKKSGPVILVLSQPDTRYFKAFAGRYHYDLHFRLYKEGENTSLLRSMEHSGNMRSCNAETILEPGRYDLLVKITAEEDLDGSSPRDFLNPGSGEATRDREKVLIVGKNFDLAHSKGKLRELEAANDLKRCTDTVVHNQQRAARKRERRRKARERQRLRKMRVAEVIEKRRQMKREKQEKQEHEQKPRGRQSRNCAPTNQAEDRTTESAIETATVVEADQTNVIQAPTPATELEPEGEQTIEKAENEMTCVLRGRSSQESVHISQHGRMYEPPNASPHSISSASANAPSTLSSHMGSEVSSVCDDDFPWDENVDGFNATLEDYWDSYDDSDAPRERMLDMSWQASCVIGLRVYSMNESTEIEVVKGDNRARRLRGGDVESGRARSPAS